MVHQVVRVGLACGGKWGGGRKALGGEEAEKGKKGGRGRKGTSEEGRTGLGGWS